MFVGGLALFACSIVTMALPLSGFVLRPKQHFTMSTQLKGFSLTLLAASLGLPIA